MRQSYFEGLAAKGITLSVKHMADAAVCADQCRRLAQTLGFSPRAQWEVAIVGSELATNMVKYAGGGTMTLHPCRDERRGCEGMCIVAQDSGPGIELDPGVSGATGRFGFRARTVGASARNVGLGLGLGTVQRLAHRFNVSRRPEGGTRIEVTRFCV